MRSSPTLLVIWFSTFTVNAIQDWKRRGKWLRLRCRLHPKDFKQWVSTKERGGCGGELFVKGYSLPTIKHRRRYENVPENSPAYLFSDQAATFHGTLFLSLFFLCLTISSCLSASCIPLTDSYQRHSVTLHFICKSNNGNRKLKKILYLVSVAASTSM